MNTVMKYDKQLQGVVGAEAGVLGQLQRQVLQGRRQRVGKNVERVGDQAFPLIGAEQKDDEQCAVDQPQQVETEVPPAGQADGVPKAGNSQTVSAALPNPPWRSRSVGVIAVPAVGRHGAAKPHPLGVRLATGVEVQPRMVGKDLDARPHDEHHESRLRKCCQRKHQGTRTRRCDY